MNLKKFGKVFTSKSVGTAPSSYKKKVYQAAVSQRLRNAAINERGSRTNYVHSSISHCILEFEHCGHFNTGSVLLRLRVFGLYSFVQKGWQTVLKHVEV